MTVGTPGFTGSRLREAREIEGLSILSLAGLIGKTRQAISQYEIGAVSPQPDVMRRITHVLNMPPDFFTLPPREPASEPLFFRSLSAATATARTRASHLFRWVRDIANDLNTYVKFPPVNIPDIQVPSDPSSLRDDDIEGIATSVRRFWGLRDGPISNLTRLLEHNGVIVTHLDVGSDSLDSFSAWAHIQELRPIVVINTDKASAVRMRFDAAHELAHLILHRHVANVQLGHTPNHKLIEEQAYRFAGAFLMPDATFSEDIFIPTLGSLQAIKPKWLVSVAAMLHRAETLELLQTEQARSLWINYSKQKWRRGEPLDDTLLFEEPHLLRRAFEVLEGAPSTEPKYGMPHRLARPASKIAVIAGLPADYFDDDSLPTVLRLA